MSLDTAHGLAGDELVIGNGDDRRHDEEGHQQNADGDQDQRQTAAPGTVGHGGGR